MEPPVEAAARDLNLLPLFLGKQQLLKQQSSSKKNLQLKLKILTKKDKFYDG